MRIAVGINCPDYLALVALGEGVGHTPKTLAKLQKEAEALRKKPMSQWTAQDYYNVRSGKYQ